MCHSFDATVRRRSRPSSTVVVRVLTQRVLEGSCQGEDATAADLPGASAGVCRALPASVGKGGSGMAVRSSEVQQLTDLELMSHLFRRAGFGARREEIEAALEKGYEATVEELLHPENQPELDHDLIYRYWVDIKEHRQIDPAQSYWIYRMINTKKPLEEKMALFWHHLFATGFAKLNHAGNMLQQVKMFREHGLGDLRTLLVELSKDPAMIFWLDNQTNTNDVHNENYGR